LNIILNLPVSNLFSWSYLSPELIGLGLHAPSNMLLDKRHVLIIWIAAAAIAGTGGLRLLAGTNFDRHGAARSKRD